jgi:FkbM family methyltransferase
MTPWIDRLVGFAYARNLRGCTRLHTLLLKGRRLCLPTRHGVRLKLAPQEYIDGAILREGYYEIEVLEALTQYLRPDDTLWDIGANLGLHALTLAKLHPELTLHAFEPNPPMATLLKEVIVANGLAVNLHTQALSSITGAADFYQPQGNCGRSGLDNWDQRDDLPVVKVETITGDELINSGRAPTPNIIKLDVEGHEAKVLQGLSVTLTDPRLHTLVFEDAKTEDTPAKELLRQKGFEFTCLSRKDGVEQPLANFMAHRN